jgi:hypothetical protein
VEGESLSFSEAGGIMPIMTAQGQHDARIAARLLAHTAVDCILNPSIATDRTIALNNVYRLLETFKVNPFFGLEDSAAIDLQEEESLSLGQPIEKHVKEVGDAITAAIGVTFDGFTKPQAIDEVEKVLKGIAYPQSYSAPSDNERSRAQQFFEQIMDYLKVA